MVINDWHVIKIVFVLLITCPLIIRLCGIFVGTITNSWKELGAALVSFSKEVVFFVGRRAHPSWVVPSMTAVITAEVRKVVIVHRRRPAVPRLVFCFGVHSLLIIGTAFVIWIPFLTTIFGVIKQVVFLKSFCLHPILIVTPPDAVQLIDQIRKPMCPVR